MTEEEIRAKPGTFHVQVKEEIPTIPLHLQTSKAEEEDCRSGDVEHHCDYDKLFHTVEAGSGTAGSGSAIGGSGAITSNIPKLYDRQEQKQLLLDYYHCLGGNAGKTTFIGNTKSNGAASQRELFLITGLSGMGKTVLATSIRDEVLSDGCFFVSGKFGNSLTIAGQQRQPQQLQRKPFAPFVSALTEWVEQVELQEQRQQQDNSDNTESSTFSSSSSVSVLLKQQIRDRVLEDKDLAAAMQTLLEEVPSLESIVGLSSASTSPTSTTQNDTGQESSNTKQQGQVQMQFAVGFRLFLRILCSLGYPLVLLMDDLQWAEPSSLDLLESIIIPSPAAAAAVDNYAGLMIIGTCRPNEVSIHDPLSEMLRRVEENGRRIVEIQTPKLGIHALAYMVSDASGLPMEECRTLAENVLLETKGNALFAQQYIQSLCCDLHKEDADGEDVGEYGDGVDASDMDSKWGVMSELSELSTQATDDRIVGWLVREMRRLPKDTQFLLQVISCLGGTFGLQVLQRASLLSKDALKQTIKLCLARNFIIYHHETQVGRFAHDKYQEAAYSLLVSNTHERAILHLRLGRNILETCRTKEELEEFLGPIVDLLLVGRDSLTNEAERESLALWCLHVGRKVALTSSFAGPWAIGYMEQGIQLLGERHWRDQYDLSLALHNAAAELASCQGNHSRVVELVEATKKNARSFMDQVQAYITSIYSLGARGEQLQALGVGFYVLEQLGYPFPRNLSWFGIQRDLYKTRLMLKRFSEDAIMNLPLIDDRKAMIAMSVIQMLHPIFATLRPEYTLLTGSRLVRLTLQYGSSQTSAVAFAIYGLGLVRIWRLEEAHIYSQLALKIEEKQSCREWKGKFFMALAFGPAFVSNQLSEAYELMEKAHLHCLKNGDVETALRSCTCLAISQLLYGHKLDATAKAMSDCVTQSNDYSIMFVQVLLRPYENVCSVLMGLTTEPMYAEHASRMCNEIKVEVLLIYGMFIYTYLAMYMNKLDLGETLMVEIRKRKATARSLAPCCQIYQVFCEGILAAALGRKKKGKIRVARRRLAKLKKLATHNPDVFSNKVCLLQAELKACVGRKDPSLSLYDRAIELSERHGFLHEQALACEKAGMMLLDCKCRSEAETYLSKSRVLYMKWGAQRKASELDKILSVGSSPCCPKTHISSRRHSSHTQSTV